MQRNEGWRTVLEVAWLVLAVAVLMVSCGRSPEVRLTAADNGGSVTVEHGGTLVVELEANPGTGYSWELADNSLAILRQESEPQFQSTSTLQGAPGIETLRFEAIRLGTQTLELIYHRPFEQNVPPAQTFSVTVTVR